MRTESLPELAVAIFTNAGRKVTNEDAAVVVDLDANAIGARKLIILADGMGGHNAGEVASRIAVETAASSVSKSVLSAKSITDLRHCLEGAIKASSDAIYEKSQTSLSLRGMGTTIAMVLLLADRAIVANVGDSRIYYLLPDDIRIISEDHTALAETMRSRQMTEEEIRFFPYLHAITRALGESTAPEVYVYEEAIQQGSILLLCSDGLTDVITDSEIHEQISCISDIQSAVDNLGRSAFHNGSNDNITIAAIEMGDMKRGTKKIERSPAIPKTRENAKGGRKSRIKLIILVILLLLMCASAAVVGYSVWILLNDEKKSTHKEVKETIKIQTDGEQQTLTTKQIEEKEMQIKENGKNKETQNNK